MKCMVLAAGYATRMYPLTENQAKPLLPINGKPILNYILRHVHPIQEIDDILVISNHKFASQFRSWADDYSKTDLPPHQAIHVLDDGSTSNDTRLGAIRDIQIGIEDQGWEKESLLIMAGDNIHYFDTGAWFRFFKEKNEHSITVRWLENQEELVRTGIVTMDEQNRVVDFQEKPSNPKTNWSCPAFYLYKAGIIDHIKQYIQEGSNPDAPGHFITHLHQVTTVLAWPFKEEVIDIGNLETYNEMKDQPLPTPTWLNN
jgi:glucose-1-phosphate thymidylyltransferase